MSLKEKSRFLGLGCYGGKQAKEFIVGYGYKGNAVNGSEQDLRALGNIPKYQLQGFDGFGGHRERALDCLAENNEFMNFVNSIEEDIVFLLFGGGGSTGSGCATILAEMLLQEKNEENGKPKKIVCPVIALPSSDEAIVKHSNAYQAVQELQELVGEGLGSTFFINNDISKDYATINSTFAKFLDTFLTNNSYGELNNFDESERLEMLRDNGAMVMSLMKGGTDRSLMLDKLSKNGIFAPIETNKICEHIGIIHAGNDNGDIEANIVISEFGKPNNVFQGYNGRSTLIAVSGLDYPVSHVSKLGDLARTAYEERQRSKNQVKKLGDLSFMNDEPEIVVEEKKKPSKLELLQRRMKK
ncbi:Cell division protein FtsZ [Clostridium sp. C105KSO15]|nr:Cell division protein FtsZ [Clostridium sp. C105KSO15]